MIASPSSTVDLSNQRAKATHTRRWIVAGAVILIATVGGAAWNRRSLSGSTDAVVAAAAGTEVRRVRVAVAPAGSLPAPRLFTRYRGDVRARRSSDLAMQRTGRLVEIRVHEGDLVRAGELLASLKMNDLDATEAMANAEVDSAEAALEEAMAGPRYQTLRAAEEKVRQTQALLLSAEDRLAREQTLLRRGAGTEQAFDDANYAAQRLRASVAETMSTLDELKEGTRSEQILAARAAVALAKAKRQQVDVHREDSVIVAPYDAIVARRWLDEGVIVGPDQTVLSIIEIPPLEARVDLPSDAAAALSLQQSVELEVSGRVVEAMVIRRQPSLDPVMRTRTIDVQFDPPGWSNASSQPIANDQIALIGQTVALRLPWEFGDEIDLAHEGPAESAPPRFWVPSAALVRGVRGLWSVYVGIPVDEAGESTGTSDASHFISGGVRGVIERRDVRVLRTAGQMSLVNGMVSRGQHVVIDGTQRIGPGVPVTMVSQGTTPIQGDADIAIAP
ncbi:MAG: HlyD family efflux transporter periplasmic adaptor subunit [Planctomycetota bacterium]